MLRIAFIIIQINITMQYLFTPTFALPQIAEKCEQIKQAAHILHESVGETYGEGLPYSTHLDMVATRVVQYADEICASADDVLPMYFGAYYHDSIEDARLTYNDVMRLALKYMTKEQAFMATEIVYALTNEKGRNRQERAGERYYSGIRQTPYAPFIKLADRMANITFSVSTCGADHMREVYRKEWPHFIESITVSPTTDIRFTIPQKMIEATDKLLF